MLREASMGSLRSEGMTRDLMRTKSFSTDQVCRIIQNVSIPVLLMHEQSIKEDMHCKQGEQGTIKSETTGSRKETSTSDREVSYMVYSNGTAPLGASIISFLDQHSPSLLIW